MAVLAIELHDAFLADDGSLINPDPHTVRIEITRSRSR
jgi:hypothetical protein